MENKNNEKKRIEFRLSDFFVEKLFFKDDTLFFGSNNKLREVLDLINLSFNDAKKILKVKDLNDNYVLNDNQIAELALYKNINFEKVNDISEVNILDKINWILKDAFVLNDKVIIKKRNPIITIMGHVDHGKTTLLDAIRKGNKVQSEVGGITQKIGAYQAEYNNRIMTFIDTPGHEAFTKMRAHGTKVTDIAVIVIASDDSIMPQTRESIDHAKAANIPIIVAINKIDKPGISTEKIRDEISTYGLIPEEWGGNVKIIEISALKNLNIDKLLQAIIDVADGINLDVPFNTLGSGVVIESNISKTRGNLIDVIVLSGEIYVGDSILIDDKVVKIKSLFDEFGHLIKCATPGIPIEIYGLGFSPKEGSNFVVVKDKDAQKIANFIATNKINLKINQEESIDPFLLFKDKIFAEKRIFNIILKADTLGILNAISDKILNFSNDEVEVKIIRKDIGELTNTDILLAEASKAYIYEFNLATPNNLKSLIKDKKISVFSFDIIYKLFEDIELKVTGLIPEKFKEEKIGEAEVLKVFEISKIGIIAGVMMKSGIVKNNSLVKIYRNNILIKESKIDSLKVQKNNVKMVKSGNECGILLKDFKDIKETDKIEIFELVKK